MSIRTGKLVPAITSDTNWYFSIYDADGNERVVVDRRFTTEAQARKAMADYVIERAKGNDK